MANIKVKAVANGYYNDRLIQAGEIFELVPKLGPDGKPAVLQRPKLNEDGEPIPGQFDEVDVGSPEAQFSERWMEHVEGDEPGAEDGEDVAISKAKQRVARVQQAPDARDVSRTIDETLEDKKIEYSQGTQQLRAPRALSSIRNEEVSPAEGAEHGPSKRGRAKGGVKQNLKGLFSKDANNGERASDAQDEESSGEKEAI